MILVRKICLFTLAVFVLTGSILAQDGPSIPGQSDERYLIGYQDVLDIGVFRHPELNVRVSVDAQGNIRPYRLEKPISAVCRSERQLANDIMDAYRVSYLRDPQVTVTVVEQRSNPLAVMGAVEKPGSYNVSKRLNLLQLIALAGGPSKDAGTRVLVVRGGSPSACHLNDDAKDTNDFMSFKMRDLQEGKANLAMMPGDVVSVLKSDLIYVYGNVIKPGAVEVREPITLLQALSKSEGLRPATDKKAIRILRQKPDSLDREEITVSLTDIEKQKAKDPYLEPNDIVAVSKDPVKDILASVKQVVTNGASGLALRTY